MQVKGHLFLTLLSGHTLGRLLYLDHTGRKHFDHSSQVTKYTRIATDIPTGYEMIVS